MGSVYSTQFYSGSTPTGLIPLPAIAAGFVAVVRDIDAYWGGGFIPWAAVHVRTDVGATFAFLAPDPNVSGGGGSQPPQGWAWRGRQVLNPGDIMSIDVGNGPVDVTISGYLLSLP